MERNGRSSENGTVDVLTIVFMICITAIIMTFFIGLFQPRNEHYIDEEAGIECFIQDKVMRCFHLEERILPNGE